MENKENDNFPTIALQNDYLRQPVSCAFTLFVIKIERLIFFNIQDYRKFKQFS